MPKNAGSNFWEAAGNITFTAIPNNFLDTIAPTLNPSELRVMLYIYRHTLGFQKLTDTISYDQFLNGQTTHNNRCLDKGAGVSRNSLVAALASLENKSLIRRQHNGKYGPVTIKLQSSALYDTAETNLSTKEPISLPVGANRAEPTKALTSKSGNQEITEQGGDQKLDRLIEPEGIINANQAQVLTENEVGETQKMDLTKETKTSKQNKPNRSAKAQIAQGSQLITTSIPGISTADANRLAEQALVNGRDLAYLSRLIRHVTGNPAIRVPAAVFTTLVRSNEDRLVPDPSSAPENPSKRWLAPDIQANKHLKPGQTGKPPISRQKIDFSKYAPQSPALPDDAPVTYPETSGRSSSFGAENPAQPGNIIDPHLKYSLQEFDSRLAIYVRHLVVEEDLLKIGFFGAKRPQATDLTAWLSSVKIYYPAVRAIQVIEQSF